MNIVKMIRKYLATAVVVVHAECGKCCTTDSIYCEQFYSFDRLLCERFSEVICFRYSNANKSVQLLHKHAFESHLKLIDFQTRIESMLPV